MRVRWTRPALSHLDEIQDYIAARNPAAAYRVTNEIIDRTEQLLAANPEAGRTGRVNATRELVLGGTSYVIAYRISQTIEILAVMHGAQQWPDKFD